MWIPNTVTTPTTTMRQRFHPRKTENWYEVLLWGNELQAYYYLLFTGIFETVTGFDLASPTS